MATGNSQHIHTSGLLLGGLSGLGLASHFANFKGMMVLYRIKVTEMNTLVYSLVCPRIALN